MLLAAGMVNENAAHALGSGAKEVRAVLPGQVPGSNKPQPSFVDERGGLQRMTGGFVRHLVRGEAAEFLIDQREQFIGSLAIAMLDGVKDACHFAHR